MDSKTLMSNNGCKQKGSQTWLEAGEGQGEGVGAVLGGVAGDEAAVDPGADRPGVEIKWSKRSWMAFDVWFSVWFSVWFCSEYFS